MSSSNSVTKEVSQAKALIAGAQQSLPAKTVLTILGVAITVPAIIAKLQTLLTLDLQVAQTYAAWRAAVAARKTAVPGLRSFMAAFVSVLKQQLGPRNPVLQTFGIPPPKARRQLTAEEKATAVALGKRTHGRRGPTGKRQRAAITVDGKPGVQLVDAQGNVVPGVTRGPIAPAPAPADEAPAPAAPASDGKPPSGNGQ